MLAPRKERSVLIAELLGIDRLASDVASPETRKRMDSALNGLFEHIGWYFYGVVRPSRIACRTKPAMLSACIFPITCAR